MSLERTTFLLGNGMNRQEHLAWCKDRALAYVNKGDLSSAVTSMVSDLTKHELTKSLAESPAMSMISIFAARDAMLGNVEAVRRFITGFN